MNTCRADRFSHCGCKLDRTLWCRKRCSSCNGQCIERLNRLGLHEDRLFYVVEGKHTPAIHDSKNAKLGRAPRLRFWKEGKVHHLFYIDPSWHIVSRKKGVVFTPYSTVKRTAIYTYCLSDHALYPLDGGRCAGRLCQDKRVAFDLSDLQRDPVASEKIVSLPVEPRVPVIQPMILPPILIPRPIHATKGRWVEVDGVRFIQWQ